MSFEEDRVSEARTGIAHSSMTLMDAVDVDALRALGECVEADERFNALMQERDVEKEAIASMLLGAVVKIVYG